jgi:CheY-like chemotaxis protein
MDPPRALPEPDFRNVLVVAETEGHGRVDREFLKKARIFAPRVVHSARAALEVLSRHGADLILCDGRLEDATGLELVAAVKAHPRHRVIPVVMVSLENRREAVIEAARLGVCGYLIRPYSQAAFARYLALARAMRDFTAQAAVEMAQAAHAMLSGDTDGGPAGTAIPVPPLPSAGTGAQAALSPDEAPRFYRLGLRRLAGGEFEAAAQAFSRATAINALYVEAHLGLAETFRARGDVRRYREAMKGAATACARARRFEELRDRFAAMLKADGEGFNPFFALGNESLRGRDYQGAVAAYRDALSLTPDKGDIFVQMGKAYHFLRRKDLAVEAVTRGLELGGGSAEARSLLYRLTGRDPEAMPEMGTDRADGENPGAGMPWALRVAGLMAGLITEGLYKLRRQAA